MNRSLSIALAVVMASAAWAQNTVSSRYGSNSGFGSVLFPGTGHAPNVRAGGSVNFPGGVGVRGPVVAPPRVAHPSHQRQVIVPYPVYVGGYGGYYPSGFETQAPVYYPDAGPQYAAPQQPPVVIINQAYRPDTANPVLRDYSDAQLPEPTVRTYEVPVHPTPDPKERAAAKAESERPTIYLIAFKDHTILPALAYWVEGENLNYVTKEGKPNSASLSLIDRDFSRQLNRERSIDFNLP